MGDAYTEFVQARRDAGEGGVQIQESMLAAIVTVFAGELCITGDTDHELMEDWVCLECGSDADEPQWYYERQEYRYWCHGEERGHAGNPVLRRDYKPKQTGG